MRYGGIFDDSNDRLGCQHITLYLSWENIVFLVTRTCNYCPKLYVCTKSHLYCQRENKCSNTFKFYLCPFMVDFRIVWLKSFVMQVYLSHRLNTFETTSKCQHWTRPFMYFFNKVNVIHLEWLKFQNL